MAQLSNGAHFCGVRLDWLDKMLAALSNIPDTAKEKVEIAHLKKIVVDAGLDVRELETQIEDAKCHLQEA